MQIVNNRPRIYAAEGVMLYPGPNTVDDAKAEKFLAHKAVKDRIKLGHLTVADAPKASMPKSSTKSTEASK